jgi:hypothetical protein
MAYGPGSPTVCWVFVDHDNDVFVLLLLITCVCAAVKDDTAHNVSRFLAKVCKREEVETLSVVLLMLLLLAPPLNIMDRYLLASFASSASVVL